MKPAIALTRRIFPDILDHLREHFEVVENPTNSMLDPAALASLLDGKEGALMQLVDRVDEALLERCPRLRAISNVAVGYNNIDVAACTRRRIMVTNTPGVLDETTADLAFALLMAAARRLTEAEAWLRAGHWKAWAFDLFLGQDIHQATLGIIGMGRIGQAVARRALGFDMRILYHNRSRLDPETESATRATFVAFDQLLRDSDFVLLQVPHTGETQHLIGARELALMKPTAILVNSARGGVVDDGALIDALKGGGIAGAALDVFENEPNFHPGFLELPNVVLVPHIGSATLATRRKMALTAASNLIAALTTGKPPNLVNPEVATEEKIRNPKSEIRNKFK
jgi:glyoxylate/hydroxypyruvate/2-ketogluconate reductase